MYRMRWIALAACALLLSVAPLAGAADEKADKELKVGDKAPDFTLPANRNESAPKKLSDYQGKKNVLVAFYPKAFTGGCTKQLCGYRDEFEVFKTNDTDVVAISADEQAESDKFKVDYNYPFTVMGDKNAGVIKAYGVGREGRNGGVMANRAVFLVDKEGIIRHIDREYNIEEDKAPLFEAIAKVQNSEKKSG